jgi:sugar-phosphatase
MARLPVFTCDAILFDMDGTLVDSTAVVERQWRRWAARHGIDPDPILDVAHGRRTIDTLRDVAPDLATATEASRFDDEEAADSQGAIAVAGAAALLRSLPEDRWAVVTSATAALARERLRAVDLPLPRVLVSADDISHGKPHPEGYLTAARLLGVRPSRCIVLEDTPPGLDAGRAAGMPVIAVTTTYPGAQLQADLVIADLTDIRATVAAGTIDVRTSNRSAHQTRR